MHIRYCEACNQETEHKEAAHAPRTTHSASTLGAPCDPANEAQAYPARPKRYIICQECGNESLDNEEGAFR